MRGIISLSSWKVCIIKSRVHFNVIVPEVLHKRHQFPCFFHLFSVQQPLKLPAVDLCTPFVNKFYSNQTPTQARRRQERACILHRTNKTTCIQIWMQNGPLFDAMLLLSWREQRKLCKKTIFFFWMKVLIKREEKQTFSRAWRQNLHLHLEKQSVTSHIKLKS